MPDLPQDTKSKIKELSVLAESEPTPEILSQLADLYRTGEQMDDAVKVCEKASKLFPDNIDCLLTYARVLVDSGQLELAEKVLMRISELGGEDAGTLIMLGQICSQRNDLAGIHSVATKLANNYFSDIRAKKFLKFLLSKKLLPSGIDLSDDGHQDVLAATARPMSKAEQEPIVKSAQKPGASHIGTPFFVPESEPEPDQPAPQKPRPATIPATKPSVSQPSQSQAPSAAQSSVISTLAMDDLLRIISQLKGIAGIEHAILVNPADKTMASHGCPTQTAKTMGSLIRSYRRAMHVAFEALDFGKWHKGVIEFQNVTVHLIEIQDYWIALMCKSAVSLGALRIAVNAIIARNLKTPKMR